jgi:hypothetical protein
VRKKSSTHSVDSASSADSFRSDADEDCDLCCCFSIFDRYSVLEVLAGTFLTFYSFYILIYIGYFVGAFNHSGQMECMIGFTQSPTKPIVYEFPEELVIMNSNIELFENNLCTYVGHLGLCQKKFNLFGFFTME